VIVSGTTKLAAVLGYPASHSKSPAMHNAGFTEAGVDAIYVALTVAPTDLQTTVNALRAVGCIGASITVPHKLAVVPLCDSLSPVAKQIGAVNTLEFRDDGTLVGHNTDAPGFVRAFQEASRASFAGKRVVLLGGGGAARAVDAGVREASASSVHVIARTPSKVSWASAAPWTESTLEKLLPSCDVLIDCTSIGLSAESEVHLPSPIPVAALPTSAIVSSLVYHRTTALLADAARAGLQVVDGAGMLLYQGAIAFELWTGRKAPIEAMRRALHASD
jgi:shikimate dehydrogenase